MKLIINKPQAHLIYDALEASKDSLHKQIKELKTLVPDDNPVLVYAYTKYGQLDDLMSDIDLGITQE